MVTIVGDVKTAEVLEKMRKYFDRIPSQPAPAPVDMTEPAQTAERRQTIDDALARLPRVDIAWHTPAALAPDDDALTVLAAVLSSGRSSRFYDNIVRLKQLSAGVGASAADTRGPGLFTVGATALPGKSVAELEQAIYAEIEKVKTEPIAGLGDRKGAQQLEAQLGLRAWAARCSGRSASAATRSSGTIPI